MLILNSTAKLLQSCPTLWDSRDCNPLGSYVHGILQARILEWVAISFSRGSSWPRDQTHISYVSCTGWWVLYHQHHKTMLNCPLTNMQSHQQCTRVTVPMILSNNGGCQTWLFLPIAIPFWMCTGQPYRSGLSPADCLILSLVSSSTWSQPWLFSHLSFLFLGPDKECLLSSWPKFQVASGQEKSFAPA